MGGSVNYPNCSNCTVGTANFTRNNIEAPHSANCVVASELMWRTLIVLIRSSPRLLPTVQLRPQSAPKMYRSLPQRNCAVVSGEGAVMCRTVLYATV